MTGKRSIRMPSSSSWSSRAHSTLRPSTLSAQHLIQRHPNLGVAFEHEELEQPVQIVPRRITLPWQYFDLSGLMSPSASNIGRDCLPKTGRHASIQQPRPC